MADHELVNGTGGITRYPRPQDKMDAPTITNLRVRRQRRVRELLFILQVSYTIGANWTLSQGLYPLQPGHIDPTT
uniref:Uncharacterized protein n=1 Tax=Anguilla anguilla TaxID=7936 RepID=A0A0E9WYP1_ANGAN